MIYVVISIYLQKFQFDFASSNFEHDFAYRNKWNLQKDCFIMKSVRSRSVVLSHHQHHAFAFDFTAVCEFWPATAFMTGYFLRADCWSAIPQVSSRLFIPSKISC